jgi:hypothetical protein
MNSFILCFKGWPWYYILKELCWRSLCFKSRLSELLCYSAFYNCGLTDQNQFYTESFTQSELIDNFSSIIIIITTRLKFAFFLILQLRS